MISIVMYALGANPTELALAPQVNGHGRQLATRRWATVKSDCDLAGGMFEPNTNNCDTFFGGSEVTCGYMLHPQSPPVVRSTLTCAAAIAPQGERWLLVGEDLRLVPGVQG